jgi:hypothetical protein
MERLFAIAMFGFSVGCGGPPPEGPGEPLRLVLEDVRVQRTRSTEVVFRGRAGRIEMISGEETVIGSNGIRAWIAPASWRNEP